MKKQHVKKFLSALAILILCLPLPLRAATSEDFIRGYASALLEREFRLKNFSLEVLGERIRVKSADIGAADHEHGRV